MLKLETIKRSLVKLICGVFSAYLAFTFLSVICLERETIPSPRRLQSSNLVPMLLVLAILAVLRWISQGETAQKIERISSKRFYGVLTLISAAVLVVQLICMRDISKPLAADFMPVRDAAGSIGMYHTMVYEEYFNKYPNNQPVTFLFAMLMRLFKKWTVVVALGILLVNLSVLLTTQMACRLSGSRFVGLITFIVGVLLFDFSYRTFVPYTDNYCVFFMVLPMAIMVNKNRGVGWLCLAAASMAMACFIKVTAAIPLIAGMIMLWLVRLPDWRRTLVQAAVFTAVMACAFAGLTVCKESCFREAGFVKNTAGGGKHLALLQNGTEQRTLRRLPV